MQIRIYRRKNFLNGVEIMKIYKELEIGISFFLEQDIITSSNNESADDLGGWNSDWFAKGND